jgi:ABC-type multidrug transport system fused ATPase/permease subunit
MGSQLGGTFLYVNLAIAIVMDVIVPIPLLALYAGGISSPIAFGTAYVLSTIATIATFLCRYLHGAVEVDQYTREKQAQIQALRKRASKWERIVSGLERKGKEVDVFFQQQVDKVKGMLLKAAIRKILIIILSEWLPVLRLFVPGFLIGAVYDLWELRRERQSFEPVEAEIESLTKQIKNGEKIARQAREKQRRERNDRVEEAKKRAQDAVSKRAQRELRVRAGLE